MLGVVRKLVEVQMILRGKGEDEDPEKVNQKALLICEEYSKRYGEIKGVDK